MPVEPRIVWGLVVTDPKQRPGERHRRHAQWQPHRNIHEPPIASPGVAPEHMDTVSPQRRHHAVTVMPDGNIIAVGPNNFLWMRVFNSWVPFDNTGTMTDIAALSDGSFIGVGTDKCLWRRPGLNGSWVQIPDSGSVLAVAARPAVPGVLPSPATVSPPGTLPSPDPASVPAAVTVHSTGAFVAYFSIQWNGGESPRSNVVLPWTSVSLDIPVAARGQSCWLRAYFPGARGNHDSGDNFTAGFFNVKYELSGSTFNPSWQRTA